MVKINEMHDGFEVSVATYKEIFASKFKAIMAAHAVAMTHAIETGQAVEIVFPKDWGDPVVIYP